MSKEPKYEIRNEIEYEVRNFTKELLYKDLRNLMDCLKQQDKDNKAILYVGINFKKVILPYEEYEKMCNRLEKLDNANPSEALECLERIGDIKLSHTETCCNETKDDDYIETLVECIDGILKNIYKEEFTTIKNALLNAQEQEKANPSEALEKLENIWCDISTNYVNEYVTIKQALLKAEKDKIIADFIRKHYKLSNDINKNYLELKKPITEEEHIKFKENL